MQYLLKKIPRHVHVLSLIHIFRGPGDLFGIRQSGLMEFKIGDIYNDCLLYTSIVGDVPSLADFRIKVLLITENIKGIKSSVR